MAIILLCASLSALDAFSTFDRSANLAPVRPSISGAANAVLGPPVPFASDWTNMNPTGAPSGYLINLAMVYDSAADRMIAYGGYDGSDHGSDQTYAYDFESNAWSNTAPEVHPDATMLLRAAYDSWAQRTILFGGWVGTITDGTYSNETWAYSFSDNTWTDLQPAQHPSARSRQGMAFDAQSGRTILFGGHTIDNEYIDDTWAYDVASNSWTDMAPGIHPPGRRSPGMVYDSNADRIILFGGWDPSANLNQAYNDTWAYDFETNTWTNMSPARAPLGRFGFGFAYDSSVDRCILFGGIGDGGTATWAYDFTNNTWSVLDTEHSPPWHAFQGMAYDAQSARTIMFGGEGGGNDTWALATAPGLPSAPGAFSIRPGNGYLELSWQPPADDGLSPVTGYRIYRALAPGGESLFAELGLVNSWTDTNVTNGETYYYQVSAVNVNGEGPRTPEASAAPDGTPPQTTASLDGTLGENGWYLSAVSVTLSATDDSSGVQTTSYRLDGGAWTTYVARIRVSGDGGHTVDFYSIDIAGNVEPTQTVMFSIDTEPPVTTAQFTGPSGRDGWYVGLVTVTLTATDNLSSTTIWYRVDGGTWQTYSEAFAIGAGVHVLEYYAVDSAGIQEPTHSQTISIDVTPPNASVAITGAWSAGWYTDTAFVRLTASDDLSGLAAIIYRIDGGPWQTYDMPFLIDTQGAHTLDYAAVDAAGNLGSTQSVYFQIDSIAPETQASLQGTAGEDGWFVSSVQVRLIATDGSSGVASMRYRIDGGAWLPYEGPVILGEGRHTVAYYSTDVAGHVESSHYLAVNIDTTAPAIVGLPPSIHATSSRVVVSWVGSDSGSGLDRFEVAVDGGADEPQGTAESVELHLADGAHTIVIRAFDRAGNVASSTVTVSVDTGVFSASGPYGATPLLLVIGIGVAAVVAAVSAVLLRRRKRAR